MPWHPRLSRTHGWRYSEYRRYRVPQCEPIATFMPLLQLAAIPLKRIYLISESKQPYAVGLSWRHLQDVLCGRSEPTRALAVRADSGSHGDCHQGVRARRPRQPHRQGAQLANVPSGKRLAGALYFTCYKELAQVLAWFEGLQQQDTSPQAHTQLSDRSTILLESVAAGTGTS